MVNLERDVFLICAMWYWWPHLDVTLIEKEIKEKPVVS